MNVAMIYRPKNRKLIWLAFACALSIHLGAIALAANRSAMLTPNFSPPGDDVQGIDFLPADPLEVTDVSPPDQPAVPDEEFYDDKVTAPIRPQKKVPVAAIRSNFSGMTTGMRGGSVKALALYAPHPNYPYEARRSGTTGSGIAQLTVNSAAGNVVDVRMAQSTGSPILDNATVSAFRRWRFKPGVASNVDVPITYTLAGVSY